MKKLLLILFLMPLLPPMRGLAQDVESEPADSMVIRGDAPMIDYSNPKKYIVNEINIHGIKHLDLTNVAVASGIKKGDEVYLPGDYISRAIKNFWNRRFFSDVEVEAEIVGDSVNFDIFLQERPMVFKWLFDGIRKGEGTDLAEKMELKRVYEFSDYIINKNINIIKEHYKEKGFRNVTVEPRIANDTSRSNAVSVTFVIDKGNKVKVGKINFDGNEVFSDRRLRSTFKKTHQKSLNFFKGAKFKEAEYENDKNLMLDFYNSKGYRNANIVSDSVYPINEKRLGIDIALEEGNKYYFRDITWVGNSAYPTELLDQMLGIRKGDTYDKKTLHKRLGVGDESDPEAMSVTSLYQNHGYLYFGVDPAETIVGEDSIDLELKIFEGKQATINEVNITGNYLVNDEVIRREIFTRPGDLYNRELIMRTLRQLAMMEHFNPEAIQPIPQPHPTNMELVDITWQLEEKASDKAEISGGWGSGMFVGSVGFELNNFSIRNALQRGAWRPYPRGDNQQLKIRGQTNGSYYKSLMMSFTEPWFGGRKPNSLTVSGYVSEESNAYYLWQSGTKSFRSLGATVGVGRRLNWPDPYFTLYNEVSYQAYQLKDWSDYFIITDGTSNIIAFTTVLGRNTVDQPIYPRRGSDFSVSLALTPPYSLFSNRDYSDPNMSDRDRYRWIEYHKWKLKGQWFFPLTRNKEKLVLMAKAEMGYLGYYNKYKKSPFEGFDIGGDGMSGYNLYGVDIIGMRGYEDGALTPYNNGDYAHVYNKYTLELRYPIIMEPRSTIYGLVFAEGGNGFAEWNKFNPFQIKRSVGAGIRLHLPIFGLIGFDWGYGFDRAVGATQKSGGQIHYMIGTQF